MLLETDRSEGNVLRMTVGGEIDVNSVRQLKKALERSIEEFQPSIEIDCKKLDYIDSTGLGTLVSALKKVKRYNGAIRIVHLKPYLHRIFEVTGLTGLFEIEVAD